MHHFRVVFCEEKTAFPRGDWQLHSLDSYFVKIEVEHSQGISARTYSKPCLCNKSNLIQRYGKIARMFEEDNEGFGLNSFNAMCEDPQCSNGINTEIISYLKQIKSKHSK